MPRFAWRIIATGSLLALAGLALILGLPSTATPESTTASVAWLAGLLAASTMIGGGLWRVTATAILAIALLASPVGATPIADGYLPVSVPTPPPNTWLVVHGDHFWAVARSHLEWVLGGPPTSAQVAEYWRVLVGANRDVIRSGDPDLIFPGEVLGLP